MEPGQGGEPRAEGAAAITPAEGKPRACRHRPGHRGGARIRQDAAYRAAATAAEARPAPPRRGGHADLAGRRDLGGQSAREHRLRPRGRAGTAGAGALRQRLRRRAARAAGRARDADERARLQPERRPAPAARAGARRAGRAGQHAAAAARRADPRAGRAARGARPRTARRELPGRLHRGFGAPPRPAGAFRSRGLHGGRAHRRRRRRGGSGRTAAAVRAEAARRDGRRHLGRRRRRAGGRSGRRRRRRSDAGPDSSPFARLSAAGSCCPVRG